VALGFRKIQNEILSQPKLQLKMKTIKTIFICPMFLLNLCVLAQTNDSTLIRQASIDYVEGYYTADVQRVERAVSPELVKRIVFTDEKGNSMINNMGASGLIFAAAKNTNPNAPKNDEPFHAEVLIFNITKDMATVMIKTNKFKFVDYAHLAKINGKWKIINVLWQFTSK
jgi:hypothetical protein